jgi:hypothetical protein
MKKEIKHTQSYNHLFFKENSRMQFDARNSKFWNDISDLQERNQDAQITVEHFLSKRLPVSYYFEDIKIHCDQPSILEQSMQIYRDHYYIVPLELYEDSSEINAELERSLLYD